MEGQERPILLRIPEAAQLVGLGRSSIYELISAGDLPVVRVGRAVRVPRLAIERWAERLQAEQNAEGAGRGR